MLVGMCFQSALVLALVGGAFAFRASPLKRLSIAHRILKPPLNMPPSVLAMSAADVDTTAEVSLFFSVSSFLRRDCRAQHRLKCLSFAPSMPL